MRTRPRRRGVALLRGALLGALLATGLAACSDDTKSDGSDPTTTTTDPSAAPVETTTTVVQPVGDPVSRYQLVVGDCFNRYDSIDVITRVPCEGEHDAEVFHYENHPAPFGEPYPSDREMQKYALKACYAQFAAFVGVLYEVSRLDIGVFTPTKENFEDPKARYRGITCYVADDHGEKLIGTMRARGE